MLLGMPVISSDVGGVADMLRRDVEGYLYPPGDVAMLAERICTVFDPNNQEMIQDMGEAARKHALQTHDPETNYRRLLEIYHEIYLCIELYQPSSDSLFRCLLPEAWGRVLFCPDGADGRRTAGYGLGEKRAAFLCPLSL